MFVCTWYVPHILRTLLVLLLASLFHLPSDNVKLLFQWYCLMADDDDDVLVLAHFSEVPAVVTKTG